MFRFRSEFAAILLGIVACVLPLAAQAQSSDYITEKDLQVAVRTFSFVYNLPKGDIEIEIIYDQNIADSSNEADIFNKTIGNGLVVGTRTLRSKMVPVSQMGSTGGRVAYITHGLQPDYNTIFEKTKNYRLLTFTTDFQCVSDQKCVMGIKAEPNIKIEISRAATDASKLEFSQALKLMIREVE